MECKDRKNNPDLQIGREIFNDEDHQGLMGISSGIYVILMQRNSGIPLFVLMKKLIVLLILVLLTLIPDCFSQPCNSPHSPAFIAPDTACQGYPLTFYTTSSGNTFTWNFCTGNVVADPELTDMGDPGGFLQTPYYIHTVKDSNLFYTV